MLGGAGWFGYPADGCPDRLPVEPYVGIHAITTSGIKTFRSIQTLEQIVHAIDGSSCFSIVPA
jgi:hypothetical protein